MQTSMIVKLLVTAIVFAGGGWFAATQSVKVTTRGHPPPADCRGKDCNVTIMFNCDASPCVPYALPEVILTKPNYKIQFEIDPATNYTFASDGIKFPSGTAGTNFACQAQGSKKFKCDIKPGTPPDIYKYAIHVQGLDVVDPWVVNY